MSFFCFIGRKQKKRILTKQDSLKESGAFRQALSTLPDFRHEAHTYNFLGVPFTLQLTRLMFDFQIRFDLLWEWLTLFPKWAPLPHTAHTAIAFAPPRIFLGPQVPRTHNTVYSSRNGARLQAKFKKNIKNEKYGYEFSVKAVIIENNERIFYEIGRKAWLGI